MNAHLSLFSGIGGIDLAAHWAGFRTVAFVERDKYCQRVLARHWPGVPIFDDVCKFDARGFRPTVISGGFPCQPFSVAGERLGAGDNRHLWPEYLRIIEECGAPWVVGENVVGIIDMALDNVLADLERIGYSARAFDIPACAVGAIHERRRVFIVAHSGSDGLQGGESPGELGEGWPFPAEQPQRLFAELVSVGQATRDGGGINDGVPDGAHALRALGNAVVPQQAYVLFKAIAEIEGIRP